MKRAFEQIQKYWKVNIITLAISLAVGGGIFCLVFFLKDYNIVSAVDAAAVSAVSVLCVGLLLWMAHLGAFDTFAFGFKQLGSMLFARDARRDGKFQDYRREKAIKRNNSSYNFLAVIAAGLLLCIALIVLEIIYKTRV